MGAAAYLRRAGSQASVLAAPLAVLAIAVWVISPRFSISGPSLIDDWDALLSAPAAMHALVRFDYEVGQRFFPTWILWNWIQWRVPGAPGNMLGPNLLDVARVALLVAGITALAWILVPRGGMGRLEHAVLCALPALVIVTVPEFGQDLARFGPEEPALVGGLMLGGALVYRGGRQLTERAPSQIRAWSCIALGFFVWCYGVFQKETSVCLLILIALAVPFGRQLPRRTSPRALRVGASLIALAALPIFVVLYEVVRIVQRGTLVYSAHVKTGGGSISVFAHAFRVMQPSTHSFAGFVLVGVTALGFAAELWRRRIDSVQLALIVLAFASLEMSVQTNVYESRYYLPTLALLAVGAARTVSALPVPYGRGIVVIAVALGLVSSVQAHSTVRHWAAGDQAGADLVAAVRTSTHRGCRLTVSGVDYERTKSIAALVGYPDGHLNCAGVDRYALIGPTTDRSPQQVCASDKPRLLGEWNVSNSERIQLLRCEPSE